MNMISKHLQKDLERQMIRVRALNSHRIKRVKASRPKSNFRIIKQMNNNAMHISANTKGHLLLLIEQSKHEYRKKLGSKGACRHADPENLSIAFGMNTISIELTYTEVISPTGFPFNRLVCKLRLDGAAISLKQLKEELNND
jgi:hypothetical protein